MYDLKEIGIKIYNDDTIKNEEVIFIDECMNHLKNKENKEYFEGLEHFCNLIKDVVNHINKDEMFKKGIIFTENEDLSQVKYIAFGASKRFNKDNFLKAYKSFIYDLLEEEARIINLESYNKINLDNLRAYCRMDGDIVTIKIVGDLCLDNNNLK